MGEHLPGEAAVWGWGGPGGVQGFPPTPAATVLTCPCSRALLAAVPEVLLQTDLRPGRPSLQPTQSPPCSWVPPPGSRPPVTARLLSRDLSYNQLQEFPAAIRTLGRLQEL